jgi:release factor glutamine methyltransferase
VNLADWLRSAEERLALAGVDSPRLDAQMLASHVLMVERPWVLAHPEAEINELATEALLQRREAREPLAYILGWREFYGRRFSVRPGVLIPRQETETLIEAALNLLPSPGNSPLSVLDVGAGSGCIAITMKLERPDLEVIAVDISPLALAVAKQNAEELTADVTFVETDTLAGLLPKAFDLIVSNPPYIAAGEELMPEVQHHEPSEALFSGPTGLEFYHRLATEAVPHLRHDGWLLVEVGHTQAKAVIRDFVEAHWWRHRTWEDLSGITRVTGFQRGHNLG